MRTTIQRLAVLAPVLLALGSTAFGADVLKLKTGKTLRGEATAYDRDTNVVTFVTESAEVLKIKADDLDSISAYKLAKTKAEKGNAEDEFKLGRFAGDVELFAHANRHYGNAVKLDANMAGQVEQARVALRTEAAAFCMRNAKAAQAKGDEKEAEKWLTTLVSKLPNEPLAAEAATMLSATYEKNHAAKDDELEDALSDILAKELKTGKKHYDSMLSSIQRGLTNTRTTSAAEKDFSRAWKSGEGALKELDKVQKGLAKDQTDVSELFDGYRVLIREHMVDSQLHIASLLTVQTDYKGAQKAVSKALSIDSGNRQALAARARIENAASQGWGWGRRSN